MLYIFQQYQEEISAIKRTAVIGLNDDVPSFISAVETRRVAMSNSSPDAERYGWKHISTIDGWDIPAGYNPVRDLKIWQGDKIPSVTWKLYEKAA